MTSDSFMLLKLSGPPCSKDNARPCAFSPAACAGRGSIRDRIWLRGYCCTSHANLNHRSSPVSLVAVGLTGTDWWLMVQANSSRALTGGGSENLCTRRNSAARIMKPR